MDEISKDPRFAHVPRDPKFRRIPRSERKVKIDKRFQSMFKDKKFKVTYTIDKRGRPLQKSSTEDLEKYYDLSSDSNEETEAVPEKVSEKKLKKGEKKASQSKKPVEEGEGLQDEVENDDGDTSEVSDELEVPEVTEKVIQDNEGQLNLRRKNESTELNKKIKKKLKDLTVDYARGEGVLLSDSSSDEETSEESEEDEGIEHMWGELDKEAETTDEVTARLAACNMDWDRIRAVDLMVLFNSFLPPGGLIHSVAIYPSDFGLQRMKDEELRGPIELTDVNHEEHSGDDDEEGSEFRREKLRQYQLNRLKYYYAVIVCDSAGTANKIYTECDGHEYESTATKLDLRFIPEDMEFEQEPREVCDKLPDMSKYQPRSFTTTALQQVKVECTWDETKLDRQEITRKINSGKIDDIDENDIKAYLASGTSDEESEVEEVASKDDANDDESKKDPLEKYKSLLKSIEQQEEEKKKREGELEFTWGLGAKEKAEKLVQQKLKKSEQLTPFEQYLEKRKDKKKAKREEKKKQKSENEVSDSDSIPSDVDMSDPYFAEELRKSKPKEKRQKSTPEDDEEAQRKAELELLLLDKEEELEKHHFDMKRIEESELLTKSKRKRLSKKKKELKESAAEDNFEVDVKDPRFSALFTSHHFNIDPADPHYRRTKGTEALISEKLKRRATGDVSKEAPAKQAKPKDKISADLAALVKSVKRNTKNLSKPIK